MNTKRRIYHTECMMSHVPPYQTMEPEFWRCSICGSVYVRYRRKSVDTVENTRQDLRKMTSDDRMGDVPEKEGGEMAGICCGHPLTKLLPCQDKQQIADHQMQYFIFGGPEHNTIRVEVADAGHPMTEEHHIEWIFLYTYQGGQMKYLPSGKRAKAAAMFSMAEEDAYAFCGREICRMGWEPCHFQCKRGHAAYAYCSRDGLFRLQF